MSTEDWATITPDNTRFARLCKLLVDGGTHALRKIFDGVHPPSDLKNRLQDVGHRKALKGLLSKKLLRPDQWRNLYPSVETVTSKNFDITLLSLLLRNICHLPAPSDGWDKEPAETSISQEDDIVRVKLYRNKLFAHVPKAAMSEADFNKCWTDIETVLVRLGEDKAAIESLKGRSLEPDDDVYYIQCLEEWYEWEERLIKAMEEMKKEVQKCNEKLDQVLEAVTPGTSESLKIDVDMYIKNHKEAIKTQTNLQPKGIMNGSVKTDDIFTNLVVHHGKNRCPEQIQRPQESHTGRKTLTEITKCTDIFSGVEEGESPKRVLISGEPGIGKTLFSQKVLRDMATDSISIPNIAFTFLITLRQLNSLEERCVNLQELLNLCPLLDEKTMVDDSVMAHIIQHTEKVFLVLDGFDEFRLYRDKVEGHDFESQYPNDVRAKMPVAALVGKLLNKKILRDSVVVVTSRPGEAYDLDQNIHFDRYVEITGFSESQVIEYVEKYFKTKGKAKETRKRAVDKVKRTKPYISFGRVPFCCLLMCVVLEWEVEDRLDDSFHGITLADFYLKVIRCIERRYNRAICSLGTDETAINEALEETFEGFAILAQHLDLVRPKRFSFTVQDLEKLRLTEKQMLYIKTSNLILCYPVSSKMPFEKPTCEYSFTHLTIQEFFVAWRLVKTNTPDTKSTEMVYIFMSGLLDIINSNNDDLPQNEESGKSTMGSLLEGVGKCVQDKDRQRLVRLRCLYEYGQEKRSTIQELTKNDFQRYWSFDGAIDLEGVTDTDCDAVVMLIDNSIAASQSSPPHVLNISGSSLTCSGLRTLLSSLAKRNCKITTLRLPECGLDDQCAKCFSDYLPNTKLTVLNLAYNELTDEGAICIMSHLPNNLNTLDLGHNEITDVGFHFIVNHGSFGKLALLDLAGNKIKDRDVSDFMVAILISSHLKTLNLSGNELSDVCKCILQSISQFLPGFTLFL